MNETQRGLWPDINDDAENDGRAKKAAYMTEYCRRRRARRRAARLCTYCGGPAEDGRATCAPCKDRVREYRRDRRHERNSRGICATCPAARLPDKNFCAECFKKRHDWHYAHCQRLRMKAFDAYGGARCNCCGETRTYFLTIDHIDGGGNKHRRTGKNVNVIALWLKNHGYPPGFQVLCHNCNSAKHHFGRCPCQDKE